MTDFATYRAIPAVNWSSLKLLAQSPKHYKHGLDNPTPDSPAMALGRLTHTAVLEPDELLTRYVCWTGGIRRGRAWDEFNAVNVGKEIVSADEYKTALGIRDAVYGHPAAAALLQCGRTEQTYVWTDIVTGVECKARLDFVNKADDYVADLKTTQRIDPRSFARTCADFGYAGQAAFYCRAADVSRFFFVAVESKPPYDVAVFEASDDMLWAGDELVKRLLRQLVECLDNDDWPGAYPEPAELDLPPWAFDDGTASLEGYR